MGITKFGIGLVVGRAPFCQIWIIVDIEKAKTSDLTTAFILAPDCLIDYKKLPIDWDFAPDRIKKVFDRPTRQPKEKEVHGTP